MPKVVPNTTPILSLLKIGKLDVLKTLRETMLVPQAVYEEVVFFSLRALDLFGPFRV
jgi:predicted nucleic acid-binding protein